MKEQQPYILKKLVIALCCVLATINPFSLKGQDEPDSATTYSDSSVSNTDDENDLQADTKIAGEVTLRNVPDTTVARMKSEKTFAYANDPAYWIRQKRVYKKGFWDYVFDFFTSAGLRIVFYSLLVCLAIFVLYRVVVVNNLFGVNSSKKPRLPTEEPEVVDLSREVIDDRIQEAIDKKDFQVAIRYLFIKTLFALNERNWIQFHPEATNNQYLDQMKTHPQNKDFRFLTQVYEYVWYGKFQITEKQFSLVHSSFKNFQSAI
jgi:hypothetical protein